MATGWGQQYGPPKFARGGILYSYTGSGSVTVGDNDPPSIVNGDQYEGGWLIAQDGSVLDSSGTVWCSYGAYVFTDSASFHAIGTDGITFLGTDAGVIFLLGSDSISVTGLGIPYGDPFWNGSAWVAKYPATPNQAFQVNDSPWYSFALTDPSGPDLIIDGRNGWPPSTVFAAPPQQVYINGRVFNVDSTTPVYSGANFSDSTYYTDGNDGDFVSVDRYFSSGTATGGDISGSVGGISFSGTFDPTTWQVSGVSNTIAINFSAPNGYASYGPSLVSWNGNLLLFYYTTSDGKDLYWNLGDEDGDYTVIVAQDDSVTAVHGTVSATGTCDSATRALSFGGAAGTGDLFAQDAVGNPIGLPPGMTFLFGSNLPGHALLGSAGVTYSPSYSYQRPDPSWGLKYVGLPNGVYLIQDENGNYTAPPYKSISTADTIENAVSGWPATNIYPQQLYINGISCQMVSGSQYDSGAEFPRNGGVSYRASAYDLTVVLSWYWDATTNFQGFVSGKYGQSSSFRGRWDGLGNFSNMTNGAIASVTAPTNAPTDGGPPQVSVNGTALQYNSLASTALGVAGTPGDVYSGSLGQTLTIYQGTGAVSYVPGTGIGAITGTYNSNTQTFSFGNGGNTVTIPGTNGDGSTATITATDTNGRPLSLPAPGSSSGGITDIAGGLDVRGNSFTLGSWTSGTGESLYGFGLAYGDAAPGSNSVSLLSLSTTRSAVNWLWTHPSTDGATDQIVAMQLDYAHRVQLYDPINQSNASIVLDPGGGSAFHGPVRIQPQGDIPMGSFTSGITPP